MGRGDFEPRKARKTRKGEGGRRQRGKEGGKKMLREKGKGEGETVV